MEHKNIDPKDRLIFAMDVPDTDQARKLAETLGDSVTFYKLGLELMMSGDYFGLLDWLVARDKKVFVDLKFFDVPATVAAAVRRLRNRGVTYATVHGAGHEVPTYKPKQALDLLQKFLSNEW